MKAPTGTVTVRMEQLGNGRSVVDGKEISFGFLVMSAVEKGANSRLAAATTPTRACRDQPGQFCGNWGHLGHEHHDISS